MNKNFEHFKTVKVKAAASYIFLALMILGISITKGGWVGAPADPPSNNLAEPINVGPAYQGKSGLPGTIGANDFWIAGIGKWASELGVGNACKWSGWKCDCVREETGGPENDGRITLGFKCNDLTHTLENFRILDINVTASQSGAACPPASAYLYCNSYSISGVPFTVPAPSDLTGYLVPNSTSQTETVNLSWIWVAPSLNGYNLVVERALSLTGVWSAWSGAISPTSNPNYNVSLPVTYNFPSWQYFRVRAYSGNIYSDPSNTIICNPTTNSCTNI